MRNVQWIEDLNEKDFIAWADFIGSIPAGNFFQSPEAFTLFQGTGYYRPFAIFMRENNELVSVLSGVTIRERGIKATFSKRTIIWGGPVSNKNEGDQLSNILDHLEKNPNNSIYTEFRNMIDMSDLKESFINHGYVFKDHLNFLVPISNAEEQRKRISKSKLRQIKSSLSKGASIHEAGNLAEIKQFYCILKDLYRKKVKKPCPPLSFFEKFFNQKNAGRVFLVKYEQKVIGGVLCPMFQNKIIYEWYVAGLDGSINGIYPSVVATWAPIEYAITHGMKYFDFLGAGKPDSDYGVREFKSKFGGELVNYGRFIKINKPLIYKIGKLGLGLIKLRRS